ncbi:unnamed protein product [Strongylus vulgaris]|uniref:Uncharacterized protein n=1 Tax=Strongylus vulgaris TaxID=40348 RepID=A0A3P7IJA3_STRVU|nr:unnamed protein product [Strongylus vulgaris]
MCVKIFQRYGKFICCHKKYEIFKKMSSRFLT